MTYSFDEFKSSSLYDKFVKDNSSFGFLKVRAYMAFGAIPASGVRVIVSKMIDGVKVVFFDGFTDSSGVIEKIMLPAPVLDSGLDDTNLLKYDFFASYDDFKYYSIVNIFENIIVVQNINISSSMGGV